MSGFASDEIQVAIYNALKASPVLSATTSTAVREYAGSENDLAGNENQLAGLSVTQVGVGGRIFDQAQETSAYPYITLGASTASDFSTKDKDGNEGTLMIQVWSEAGGQMEVKGIMKSVQDVLNHASLIIFGQTLIDLRCEFYDVSRLIDQDEFYYRGSMRFRTLTLETT